jgi:hypothetical protein
MWIGCTYTRRNVILAAVGFILAPVWGRGQHHGARAAGSCSMWTQARAPRPHRTCLCKISRAPRTATSRNPPMGPRNKCCLVRARADLFFAYMATTKDPLVRSRCSFVLWASGSGVQGQIRDWLGHRLAHSRGKKAPASSASRQQAASTSSGRWSRGHSTTAPVQRAPARCGLKHVHRDLAARACTKSLAPPAPLRAATPRWGPEISAVLYVFARADLNFLPIWPQLPIRWSVFGVISCFGRQEAECKAKYAKQRPDTDEIWHVELQQGARASSKQAASKHT